MAGKPFHKEEKQAEVANEGAPYLQNNLSRCFCKASDDLNHLNHHLMFST